MVTLAYTLTVFYGLFALFTLNPIKSGDEL